MVVRVDQPGHQQAARRVDDFLRCVRREIGTDRSDGVALDQDVGDGGFVDVAIVIVDLSAADQRSFTCHLRSTLRSTARSSMGTRRSFAKSRARILRDSTKQIALATEDSIAGKRKFGCPTL